MYYKLPQLSLQIGVAVFHCVNQPVGSTFERKVCAYKITNKNRGVCLLYTTSTENKKEISKKPVRLSRKSMPPRTASRHNIWHSTLPVIVVLMADHFLHSTLL
jgi:hypothetical protein